MIKVLLLNDSFVYDKAVLPYFTKVILSTAER